MQNISKVLTNLFLRHRIVFWYDVKKELRGEFEALILPGVELIELANNEFGGKIPHPAPAARSEIPDLPRRACARRSGKLAVGCAAGACRIPCRPGCFMAGRIRAGAGIS